MERDGARKPDALQNSETAAQNGGNAAHGAGETAQEHTFRRMMEEPVRRLVCRLAAPTIVSMLITSFYNMADTFFVGRLDTSAVAAVGSAVSLMAVIQAVGFFFGHGSGNHISRELGSRRRESAEAMAATGFFSALLAGVALMVPGLLLLEPLCLLLGATDTMLPYAMDYVRYILLGMPFMMSSLVLNNQLRFQGNAFYGMIGIATGAVLNLGLDPLFIFVLDMGAGGAALATAISQFASWLLLFLGANRAGGNLPVRWKNFHPQLQHYREIFRGGTPSLLRQSIASVAVASLTYAARPYSDAAVAAMTIVSRVMMFANSALIGFGQGFQPVCGFNYGARRFDRVREAYRFCVRTSAVVLVVLAAAAFLLSPWIVTMFRDDPLVVEVGTAALRLQCVTFPLASVIVLTNMMLQTIGSVWRASFLALARQGLLFIPFVLLLPHVLDVTGIVLAQPIADVLSFVCAIVMAKKTLAEMRCAQEAQQVQPAC